MSDGIMGHDRYITFWDVLSDYEVSLTLGRENIEECSGSKLG